MLGRVIDKLRREIYRLFHPYLWGKKLEVNGVPRISGAKNLCLGYNVSINEGVYIQAAGGVTLGDRVTVSSNVMILTCGLDTKNYPENAGRISRDHVTKSVTIGEGVWLAAGALICPGVTIAKNCIVAAGSVVPKSLTTENALYGGNPARLIKILPQE